MHYVQQPVLAPYDTWEAIPAANQTPVTVPVSKNFPWQYQLAQSRWKRLLEEVIDGADVLGDVLDREKLFQLRDGKPLTSSIATPRFRPFPIVWSAVLPVLTECSRLEEWPGFFESKLSA